MSNTFNVADLSPYHGAHEDEAQESRTTLSEGGRADTARLTDTTIPSPPSPPSGPLTRARAKALPEKVTSLLSTLHLGTPLDGMLLTADTLCVVRYIPQESPPWSPTIEAETRCEEEKAAALAASGTTALSISGLISALRLDIYGCVPLCIIPKVPLRP